MNVILKVWQHTTLVVRIVIGLVIGAVLGLVVPQLTFISIFGTLFVGALKAMAPVLVAVLVASAVAKAGGGLGPRFRTVITFYLATTLLAAFIAVFVSFLFPVKMVLTEATASGAPSDLAAVFTTMARDLTCNPVQ